MGLHTLPFSFAQNTHLTMNAFILLACVAASSAQHVAYPYVNGVPIGYAGAAPVAAPVYNTAAYPYAAPVPAPVAPSSQFQAQDEFGNLQYGYANINSQKHEIGNTYGGVTGGFHYVDANGVVQTRQYIADHLGFRVQATDLPVAPAVPEVEPLVAPVHEYELPVAPVFDGKAPEPVQDTPEVAAAKAAHIALVEANALPKAPEFYDLPVAPVDTPEVAAAKAEHMKAVEAALAGQTYAPTYTHTAPPAEVKVVEAPAAVAYAAAPIAAPIAPLAARLPYAGYAGYHYAATPAVTTAAVAPTTVVASAPVTTSYAGYGYPAAYGYAAGYGYPYGYAGAYPAAYSTYTPYAGYAGYGYAAYTPYAGYAGYGYHATPVTTAHAVTHKVE